MVILSFSDVLIDLVVMNQDWITVGHTLPSDVLNDGPEQMNNSRGLFLLQPTIWYGPYHYYEF